MKDIWPKELPTLSQKQKDAQEKWMRYWHEVLPKKYGIIEKFNHGFPAKFSKNITKQTNTLEIGAGLGEHIKWENITNQNYHLLEYRKEWCEILKRKFPLNHVEHTDIQEKTSFKEKTFDRVIAIHVLEHLPNLPKALKEIKRILKPGGYFDVVIPCEGGLAYEIARKISSERLFEKKFKMKYKPIIKSEHVNTCYEIINELRSEEFIVEEKSYFPLVIPISWMNLVIGLRLTYR